jgi:hypothetical protein
MALRTKGQIIIEVLIAFGLASILLPAILTGFVSGRSGRVQQEQRSIALALLKEAEEAVRVYRDADWNAFAVDGEPQVYHPQVSGSTWILTPGEEEINGFTRSITVERAYRDANNQIAETGTIDPSTKKVTLKVSWGILVSDSIVNSYYLTRWKNISYSENQSIQPSGGGFGDWCKPGLSLTNIDLDRQGHPTSIRAFETLGGIDGNRILAGTGANSSGPAFSNIKVIGNGPPAATWLGDYNGTPQIKVNGLIGEDNYAFLATDSKGVIILSLTTNPYQEIGSFNPRNMKKVRDVYVVGDTGYAVSEDKFYIFSISTDRTSTAEIGELPLSGGAKVIVDPSNQYAYVPNPDTGGELKIIDVHSNPGSLTSADVKNVDVNAGAGRDVFINAGANRAYLATAASLTQPEFFIINIEDKANPIVITNGGTYDTAGMDPSGVVVVSGNRAIIVGIDGNEYQVFSIDGDVVSFCPNHGTTNDFLNIDSGVFTLSAVFQTDGYAYSYIATGDADAELKVVEGGPGGPGGGTGVFESETIPIPDPGHDIVFNSFSATVDPDLSFKISIKHGISGSCASVTYSDSDFVDFVPGPLPLTTIGAGYVNPGQCLRYRATNIGTDPITFDVSFNYSP